MKGHEILTNDKADFIIGTLLETLVKQFQWRHSNKEDVIQGSWWLQTLLISRAPTDDVAPGVIWHLQS